MTAAEREKAKAEIAAAVASAAARAGHHVRHAACTALSCPGCQLVRQARGAQPQLELGEAPPPKPRGQQRSREPGEEG